MSRSDAETETQLAFQLCFERSAEIHSGEEQRERVSSAQAPRKAQLFCGISVTIINLVQII
ncbi:hypothetical protein D9754_15775 [Planomicrobium sp. Y74]|nr:hypothetical protein D9754_15775 [Planomicrobium sp. Y74]